MSHKIEISDKTYEELKEYCTLNKLKIGQFADKLVYEGLMIEKYGDTPFTSYKKKTFKELKEFPVSKFEQEYLAQPEPIPEEPPEVPFMKPEVTEVPEEATKQETKIIRRRLK